MTTSDTERCLDMYDALASGTDGYDDEMHILTIPGAPWSKARPRFGKGRTFKTKDDTDAQHRTGTYLRSAVRQPYTGNVFVGCLFFRPNRQRIDTDNLLKHICDAATGIVWKDDSQCTGIMGILELDPERPRTVVVIGRHETTLVRGTDASIACEVCAGPIYLEHHTGKIPKTCSPECRLKVPGAAGSLAAEVTCPVCDLPFKRKNHAQKICSEPCRYTLMRNRNRKNARPRSQCSECGKQLAHHRGGRCRQCWLNDPAPRRINETTP
jgi:Holliday junction resolvase RusA-like endonuclease